MQIFNDILEWRNYKSELKPSDKIGFVPTMGNLHKGHLALVQQARQENDIVVVSIFINPTQFNDSEDYALYPRSLEEDIALLEGYADCVFCPQKQDIYAEGSSTVVDVSGLSGRLMGATRPGHFRGVATVVLKLLNIIQANNVYFGWKDYQQVLVIKQMVQDLFIPTTIHALPTVRDEDGVALSSRNGRLSPKARQAASIIPKAIEFAQTIANATAVDIQQQVTAFLSREKMAQVISVDICDAGNLGQVSEKSVLLLAVSFDDVLLIDQAILRTDS